MQNSKPKFKRNKFFFILSLVTISLFPIPYSLIPQVFAQGNSITVSPQLYQLDLSKEKPEAEFSYTNSTNQTVEITLSMQDVKELEDRGIPSLLDQNDAKNYKYGLSSWATFSNKNLVIAPSETKTVTVFINKTRLSQGGHYASVLAEIKQISDTKAVKLRAILSSLLFVRTGSEFEIEDANLAEIQLSQDWFSYPTSVIFRLQNTGNVDITPYGVISIKDPFGRQVSRSVVNEDSAISLPESIRRYTTKIKSPEKFLAPGIYKANVEINYGKKHLKKSMETHFFTLGSLELKYAILILVLIVAGSFVAVKFPRKKDN